MIRTDVKSYYASIDHQRLIETGKPLDSSRFGEYVRRWSAWVRSGLPMRASGANTGLGQRALVEVPAGPLMASRAWASLGYSMLKSMSSTGRPFSPWIPPGGLKLSSRV